MRSKRMTPPVRRTTRRWRTPPAITHSGEAFEGGGVLEELKDPLGVLLWQVVRDVYLWGSLHPDERAELFAPGAEAALLSTLHDAEVEVRLETALMTLVVHGEPAAAHWAWSALASAAVSPISSCSWGWQRS